MSGVVSFDLPTPKYAIIRNAFIRLCADELFHMLVRRKWLPAETWCAALTMSGLVDERVCIVDAKKFNAAMIRSKLPFDGSSMDRFDGTNETGVFRIKFQNVLYYMVTAPYEQTEYPCPLDIKWKEGVVSMAANVLSIIRTRSTASLDTLFNTLSFNDELRVTTTKAASTSPTPPETTTISQTASRRSSSHCPQQDEQRHEGLQDGLILHDETMALQQNQKSGTVLCYWSSRDAWNLFAGGGLASFEQFSADVTKSGGQYVSIVF